MSPAAGPLSPSDGAPAMSPAFTGAGVLTPAQKDKVIEWYRGEFAASNAIIDALCHHLVQIGGSGSAEIPAEYEGVFSAIHRRRLNWIPVLQMQKYFTISDVAHELRKAAARREKIEAEAVVETVAVGNKGGEERVKEVDDFKIEGEVIDSDGKCNGNVNGNGCLSSEGEDSPDSEITDTGSHEVHATLDHIEICDNHEECAARREQIKLTKGFVAKEPVKGHMVNVVKGLKMYENIFTDQELCKLNDFVHELRAAGQNGELLGGTYVLFNKQMKANKREQIQLGVPIFGQIKDDTTHEQKSNIEQIPVLLQSVIDHLVQWHVLPENRKPNGCIINYFEEGEYSQPFLKPPHLDQPLCTLVLSESTMAYGRTVVNDGDGNFKGQLMLPLKQGSLLVMRNNSADMARHVMCASPSRRVSITFSRIRPDSVHNHHTAPLSPLPQAMTMWQPGMPNPQAMSNGDAMDVIPKWGVIRAPLVMLAPVRPVVMNARRMPRGGTGVFLPWAVGSKKPAKHLPPRAQKGRFLSFSRVEEHVSDTMSDPGVEGRIM
ncbi:hypothetical protein BVRB_7g179400 [Beta vulgaris subsp. vulgaris]|uniref:Fe2OG dioxygenase domain-containing protein n=1 Tax=Beta vulgaris subsp. vulgaris TaxID=3555 RepID=A0A0J8B715_BETVV|nr:hypothetical protein BVRB_7g179400 [Beta vulgaris subsp. vulgaris]UGY87106.1 RNA demethylase ALKBH10B-like protein [Beta vulgaris]